MELTLWQIIALAAVQGVTEFLPVSSSGHLVIIAAFLSPDGSVGGFDVSDVNIVLHGGTLGSILVVYWHRVWRLVSDDRRTIGLLFVGTLPAVAIGLPLKKFADEALLSNPLLAGCLLVCTGIMLLLVSRIPKGTAKYQEMSYFNAVLIGFSQAAAILPGLSRSGTTISCGIRLGLSPDAATTFSFLLAIPVIGGACALEIISQLQGESSGTPVAYLTVGAAVSFLVGLGALTWLIRWVEHGRLQAFAWWCIPIGIAVVIWQLFLLF